MLPSDTNTSQMVTSDCTTTNSDFRRGSYPHQSGLGRLGFCYYYDEIAQYQRISLSD
jgi:hypothetical protein